MLVLEILGARFNRDLAPIGNAAVIGYLVRTAILGDAYPFRPSVPIGHLSLKALLLIVPIMGLLAAPTGHFFIVMFNQFSTLFPARWPLAVRLALGGPLVGTIGI